MSAKTMRRVAILTGGGDAPGLNAVIRAVTKSLIRQCAAEVIGVEDGYLGLLQRRVRPLDWQSVCGLAGLGGTVLGTTNRVSPLQHEGRDGAARRRWPWCRLRRWPPSRRAAVRARRR